jgi:hypothetical protein
MEGWMAELMTEIYVLVYMDMDIDMDKPGGSYTHHADSLLL